MPWPARKPRRCQASADGCWRVQALRFTGATGFRCSAEQNGDIFEIGGELTRWKGSSTLHVDAPTVLRGQVRIGIPDRTGYVTR